MKNVHYHKKNSKNVKNLQAKQKNAHIFKTTPSFAGKTAKSGRTANYFNAICWSTLWGENSVFEILSKSFPKIFFNKKPYQRIENILQACCTAVDVLSLELLDILQPPRTCQGEWCYRTFRSQTLEGCWKLQWEKYLKQKTLFLKLLELNRIFSTFFKLTIFWLYAK